MAGNASLHHIVGPVARASVTAWALVCLPGCSPANSYARLHSAGSDDGGAAILFRSDAADVAQTGAGGSGGLTTSTGAPDGVTGAADATMGEADTGGQASDGEIISGDLGSGGGPSGRGGDDNPGSGGQPGGGGMGGAGRGGSAEPRIVSIDFGDQQPMVAGEVAGVKAAAHWNEAPGPTGSLSSLLESDGTRSSATASWSAGDGGLWTLGWTDAPGDTRMLNGYLDPYSRSAPATVTVKGLPLTSAAGSFDVYVYAYGSFGGGSRTASYSIGNTSVTIAQTGPSAARFAGYTAARSGGSGNYVVFKGVRGNGFTLTATPEAASGTSTRAPVNGLQIVFPSGPP